MVIKKKFIPTCFEEYNFITVEKESFFQLVFRDTILYSREKKKFLQACFEVYNYTAVKKKF